MCESCTYIVISACCCHATVLEVHLFVRIGKELSFRSVLGMKIIILMSIGPKKDKELEDKVASLKNMGFEEVNICILMNIPR